MLIQVKANWLSATNTETAPGDNAYDDTTNCQHWPRFNCNFLRYT